MNVLRPLRPELIALLSALLLAGPAAHAADPPAVPAADAALPGARTADLSFSVTDGTLFIKDAAASKTFRLHPIAAAVFVLSDGKTAIGDIAKTAASLTGYDVDEATTFGALDALADAKLLLARVTPPGGSDLDLIVTTDGALGTEIVASSTAAEGTQLDASKLKASENAQKQKLAPARAMEREVKYKDIDVQKATSAKNTAVAELRRVREQAAEEAKKSQNKEQQQKMKVSVDKAKAQAQAQATVEVALRKKLAAQEMEKKKAQQIKQK